MLGLNDVMTDPAQEILDLVDAQDEVIGRAPRGEAYARRLRHRAVFVLAHRADGRIFVHERTATKLIFPSHFDMFVGGVVGAGETYDDAALREAREELGVDELPSPRTLFRFLYDGPEQTYWSAVYTVETPEAVSPQVEEVATWEFLSDAQIDAELSQRHWVPDGLEAWQIYRERSE